MDFPGQADNLNGELEENIQYREPKEDIQNRVPKEDVQYLDKAAMSRQTDQDRKAAYDRYAAFKNQESFGVDLEQKERDFMTKSLRRKKTYVHERKTPAQLRAMFNERKTAALLNDRAQRIIQYELFRNEQDPYKKYKDLVQEDKKENARTVKLHHASGTSAMDDDSDVIKFRIAGSRYTSMRQEHNGFSGKQHFKKDNIGNEKYEDVANRYIGTRRKDFVNVWERTENQNFKTKKVYNLPGPSTLNSTDDEYYSTKDMERIVNVLGMENLDREYHKWQTAVSRPKQIRIIVEAHSRSAAAVPVTVMSLMNSAKEKYPEEFTDALFFDIVQYDPVPGSLHGHNQKVNWKGNNERELTGDNESGMKLAGLGNQFRSTVIYSLRSGHELNLFTPQLVRGAQRIILTTRNHDVGQNVVDESQYRDTRTGEVDPAEKMHRIAYTDAKEGQVYRGSGINDLPRGVYVADENNILVKLNKPEDAAYFIAKMTGNYKKAEFERKYPDTYPGRFNAWPEDQPVQNEQHWYLKEKDRAAVVTQACEWWFADNREQEEAAAQEGQEAREQEINAGQQAAEIRVEKKPAEKAAKRDNREIYRKYYVPNKEKADLIKKEGRIPTFTESVDTVQRTFDYYSNQIYANRGNSVSAHIVLGRLRPLQNELTELGRSINYLESEDQQDERQRKSKYADEEVHKIDSAYSQFKEALVLYNREHALTTAKGFFKSMWGKAGLRRDLSKRLEKTMESGRVLYSMSVIMGTLKKYIER